jgi:hypothetical protein
MKELHWLSHCKSLIFILLSCFNVLFIFLKNFFLHLLYLITLIFPLIFLFFQFIFQFKSLINFGSLKLWVYLKKTLEEQCPWCYFLRSDFKYLCFCLNVSITDYKHMIQISRFKRNDLPISQWLRHYLIMRSNRIVILLERLYKLDEQLGGNERKKNIKKP